MVVHACNPSSQEDEAGTQEFKASLVYIARSCSKKRRRKEEEEEEEEVTAPSKIGLHVGWHGGSHL
jgi:hypothetical protein